MSTRRALLVAGQALRQVRLQNRLLRRSPAGAFFTFAVPLIVLFALSLVDGDGRIATLGVAFPSFYTPAMAAFAITCAAYVTTVTSLTQARDAGLLKRVRGTPMPGWLYLFGRVGSAVTMAVIAAAGVVAVGCVTYGVAVPWDALPRLLLAVTVGAVCFAMIGVAATAAVPSHEASLPLAYGTLLPLSFVSDVFFPTDSGPHWLRVASDLFPLRPLAHTLESAFIPGVYTGDYWSQLAAMVLWALGAALVAHRFFSWERRAPRRSLRSRTVRATAT